MATRNSPTRSQGKQKSAAETEAILEAAKLLLRKQKRTYRELGRHLGLSLPSVKRAMNSPGLPLGRVLEICDFLGFTLAELLAFARKDGSEGFRFTAEQEQFFAAHPHFLAYFFEVLELTPGEIEKKHGISRRATHVYLRKLESLGVLELHPGDVVKHQVRGSILWDDHSPLGKTFSRSMITGFSAHAVGKLGAPDKMLLELHGWSLTDNEYSEWRRRYRELAAEFRQMSVFNRKARRKAETRYVSAMMVADFWEDPFAREVKEIGSARV